MLLSRLLVGSIVCGLLTPSVSLAADPAPEPWSAVLERVTPAVVSIRTDSVRAFDTVGAGNSQATGFVIDAEQGLILTNRHVVQPGPIRAEAVFLNNEEVALEPIYRDPVHDFGIFRFDPEAVQYMDLVEVPLAPEHARVGAEVRVIGNDAGEKISILDGTIARLDRSAPTYGVGNFNDFNTFYIQSASSTSGGSSGSPVIDQWGRVIALNAGGATRAASSFFLPLDRVVYALEHIRAGDGVPRGTLQTTWVHRPYDEVRRLGLREATEARLRERFSGGTGALVVASVVPGGPAHGKLLPGDVVVAVDDELVTSFVPMEAALDSHVGGTVKLTVERGGKPVDVSLDVDDLHSVTPDRYVEIEGAVLHELSYQKARAYGVPVDGIYVASNGYGLEQAGLTDGAVIRRVAEQEVHTVDDLVTILGQVPDGARVRVEWFWLGNPRRTLLSSWEVDRRWFESQVCTRDASGDWPCAPLEKPAERMLPEPATATLPPASSRVGRKVAPSLVTVDFDVPVQIDGVHGDDFRGTGVIVDAEEGLVLVDRDTVPIALGDVRVIVGGSVVVPGRVVWLHPSRNMALIRYEPELLGDTPVAAVRWSTKELGFGKSSTHVGLQRDHTVVSSKATITWEGPLWVGIPRVPFFREVNSQSWSLSEVAGSTGGVLVDRRGRAQALWASYVALDDKEPDGFFRALPGREIQAALDFYRADPDAPWPVLGAELSSIELTDARDLGLSDTRAAEVEARDGRRRVLSVARVTADAPAAQVLRSGDLVLEVNGRPAVQPWVVEELVRDNPVQLTILREGTERTVEVAPKLLSPHGTERVLSWAGAILQPVPQWIPEQRDLTPEGIYVSWYWYGTPAARHGLRATSRIIAVNDVEVGTLDEFVAALPSDATAVRLTYLDLRNRQHVLTLKPNPGPWPTAWLEQGEDGRWIRKPVE